jgi:hypothetical protein
MSTIAKIVEIGKIVETQRKGVTRGIKVEICGKIALMTETQRLSN